MRVEDDHGHGEGGYVACEEGLLAQGREGVEHTCMHLERA